MSNAIYNVLRTTDVELVEILKNMVSDNTIVQITKLVFYFLSEGQFEINQPSIESISKNENVCAILENVRLFRQVYIYTNLDTVFIRRNDASLGSSTDNHSPFDLVEVQCQNGKSPLSIIQLGTFVQQHFSRVPPSALGEFLGDDAKIHYEAREVALTRLETLTANLTKELAEARRRQEEELINKERLLEENFHEKETVFNQKKQKDLEDQKKWEEEFNRKREALYLQEAKSETRKISEVLSKRFEKLSENFDISKKTGHKRWIIHTLCGCLMIISGVCCRILSL